MQEAEAPDPGAYSPDSPPADASFGEDLSGDGSNTANCAPLTAGLLARKGEAQPAHEPYSKARVSEGAREMAPGARHQLDQSKTGKAKHHAARPGAARAELIGPVVPESASDYSDNPYQFAVAQGLKDIIEREPANEPAAPVRSWTGADAHPASAAAPPNTEEWASSPRVDEIASPPRAEAPVQRPNQIAAPIPISEMKLSRPTSQANVHPAPAFETPVFDQSPIAAEERVESPAPAPAVSIAAPRPVEAVARRRAAVTFRMPTRDYLRMKLASAELETSCQDLLLSALEEYLDALGIERLDQCPCLARAAGACDAAGMGPR